MSSHTLEMIELVQRYAKEKYNKDLTQEAIMRNNKAMLSTYFDALAHFRMKNHYYSLDEVEPAEGKQVYIRIKGKSRTCYEYVNGEWIEKSEMSIDDNVYW